MSPEQAIGYLLQHVSSVLARQSDQILQEQLGIGMSQFKLLMILQQSPHIRQRKLANHLGQTEASISRQIKILHDKGLLTTQINPESKRERMTIPMAKGLRITEAAQDIMLRYGEPMLALLSTKQRKQLADMLGIVHSWTCQPGKLISCDHPFKI
jgi:DNA-binding MarR family transcriptional regulator